MSFDGARARVGGATGLAGGGVTSGELTAAIAGLAPGDATYITQTANGTLSAEQALDALSGPGIALVNADGSISLATGSDLPAHTSTGVVVGASFIIDGGGVTITTGVKGDLQIPFAGTITQWTILPDQSGSISIGVWKDTYANYPPVVGDLLFTATLGATTKSQSGAISHAVTAGDILRFNVASVTTVERVTLALTMTRDV